MEILNFSVFKLDIASGDLEDITKDVSDTDFGPYLNDLIGSVDSSNSRNFRFQRESTEVYSLITGIIGDGDFNENVNTISERLLEKEIEAQRRIAHLEREIQKGVLIYTLYKSEDTKNFFICKADHLEFLNEENFRKTRGLPTKKKVFKAFNAVIGDDDTISSALVYDTNATMAKYWWQDFLELEKIYDDAHNTYTALDAIDSKVFRTIKKKHPSDHTYLRNSAIRYFRSNEDFSLEGFVDNIFDNYIPEDENLDVDKLKRITRELPEKIGFDNRFTIERSEITKRQKSTFKLSDHIDLIVKQDIEIGTTIKAVMDEDGQKYVKIRSDSGYEKFKRSNQS